MDLDTRSAGSAPLADLMSSPPATTAPRTDAADSEPALRGTSPSFSIPKLLQFLATGRRTGTLRIRTEDRAFRIDLEAGQVVHATCDARPTDELLGSILLDRGLVDADRLAALIEESQRRGILLGTAMRQAGLIDEADLEAALTHQVQLLFHHVTRIEDASFELIEAPPDAPEPNVDLAVMELLLTSARDADHARQSAETSGTP